MIDKFKPFFGLQLINEEIEYDTCIGISKRFVYNVTNLYDKDNEYQKAFDNLLWLSGLKLKSRVGTFSSEYTGYRSVVYYDSFGNEYTFNINSLTYYDINEQGTINN
jgi:hypothetical protein